MAAGILISGRISGRIPDVAGPGTGRISGASLLINTSTKKAELLQRNRALPQLFFSVESSPTINIHCKFKSSQSSKARLQSSNVNSVFGFVRYATLTLRTYIYARVRAYTQCECGIRLNWLWPASLFTRVKFFVSYHRCIFGVFCSSTVGILAGKITGRLSFKVSPTKLYVRIMSEKSQSWKTVIFRRLNRKRIYLSLHETVS